MNVTSLTSRAQALQGELQRAIQAVSSLNEQLETAKANQHMIKGHLNEVVYLIGEYNKDTSQENLGETENDGAIEQKQE